MKRAIRGCEPARTVYRARLSRTNILQENGRFGQWVFGIVQEINRAVLQILCLQGSHLGLGLLMGVKGGIS
jgi:hypothetical protein